jgi:hypothetical protein
MLHHSRKSIRRTARALLVFLTGTWLLAAMAPCVAAAPMPMPAQTGPAPCHADRDHRAAMPVDCDALSALHCQQSQPTPPSVTLDIPVTVPVQSVTLAPRPLPFVRDRLASALDVPSPPVLDRKQSRLLI